MLKKHFNSLIEKFGYCDVKEQLEDDTAIILAVASSLAEHYESKGFAVEFSVKSIIDHNNSLTGLGCVYHAKIVPIPDYFERTEN